MTHPRGGMTVSSRVMANLRARRGGNGRHARWDNVFKDNIKRNGADNQARSALSPSDQIPWRASTVSTDQTPRLVSYRPTARLPAVNPPWIAPSVDIASGILNVPAHSSCIKGSGDASRCSRGEPSGLGLDHTAGARSGHSRSAEGTRAERGAKRPLALSCMAKDGKRGAWRPGSSAGDG